MPTPASPASKFTCPTPGCSNPAPYFTGPDGTETPFPCTACIGPVPILPAGAQPAGPFPGTVVPGSFPPSAHAAQAEIDLGLPPDMNALAVSLFPKLLEQLESRAERDRIGAENDEAAFRARLIGDWLMVAEQATEMEQGKIKAVALAEANRLADEAAKSLTEDEVEAEFEDS